MLAFASMTMKETYRMEKEETLVNGYSVEELRELAREGIESGISTRSLDELKAEARRRAANRAERR